VLEQQTAQPRGAATTAPAYAPTMTQPSIIAPAPRTSRAR
jgi:hypothetical protein